MAAGIHMTGIWLILDGPPRTKKNSQHVVRAGQRLIPIQSDAYKAYERDCLQQLALIRRRYKGLPITDRVNVKCIYHMPTRRAVDLVNLLEASDDILVRGGILADDNCTIVASHDGSCVMYDKHFPRVEIEI